MSRRLAVAQSAIKISRGEIFTANGEASQPPTREAQIHEPLDQLGNENGYGLPCSPPLS
jgi:hypothetical protein